MARLLLRRATPAGGQATMAVAVVGMGVSTL